MYLIGSGGAAAFLKAAAKFGGNFGGELGTYAGQRVKNWLEQAREARNEEFVVVIRDPSLTAEVVVTGYEPADWVAVFLKTYRTRPDRSNSRESRGGPLPRGRGLGPSVLIGEAADGRLSAPQPGFESSIGILLTLMPK